MPQPFSQARRMKGNENGPRQQEKAPAQQARRFEGKCFCDNLGRIRAESRQTMAP